MNIARTTEVIREKYDDYAQHGIDYHGREIIVANWNKVPDKLTWYVEHEDVEIAYDDEVITDDDGVYHRQDESTWIIWNYSCCSIDHFQDDDGVLIEYIESELTDNASNALSVRKLVNRLPEIATLISDDHENGFYEGMNDDPNAIMRDHPDYGRDRLFFAISDSTPFMLRFQLWRLNDDEE